MPIDFEDNAGLDFLYGVARDEPRAPSGSPSESQPWVPPGRGLEEGDPLGGDEPVRVAPPSNALPYGMSADQLLSDKLTVSQVFPKEMADDFIAQFGDVEAPLKRAAKTQFAGLVGVDAVGIKERAYEAFRVKKMQELRTSRPDYEPTLEELEAIDATAKVAAKTWYEDARRKQTGINPNATPDALFRMMFIDEDPEHAGEVWGAPTRRWIKDFSNSGPAGALLAPFVAAYAGTRVNVTDLEAGVNTTYNDGSEILAGLDWAFRVHSPFDYLATAAAAGGATSKDRFGPAAAIWNWDTVIRGWGTEEHIELLSRGEGLMTLSEDLGMQYMNWPMLLGARAVEAGLVAVGVESAKGVGDSFTAASMAFAFSLVEPDGLSLLTAGMSKAAAPAIRGVLEAAQATAPVRYAAQGKTLHKAAEDIVQKLVAKTEDAEGLTGFDAKGVVQDALREIERDLGPAQARAIQTQLAAVLADNPNFDPQVIGRIEKAIAAASEVFASGGAKAIEDARVGALAQFPGQTVETVGRTLEDVERAADEAVQAYSQLKALPPSQRPENYKELLAEHKKAADAATLLHRQTLATQDPIQAGIVPKGPGAKLVHEGVARKEADKLLEGNKPAKDLRETIRQLDEAVETARERGIEAYDAAAGVVKMPDDIEGTMLKSLPTLKKALEAQKAWRPEDIRTILDVERARAKPRKQVIEELRRAEKRAETFWGADREAAGVRAINPADQKALEKARKALAKTDKDAGFTQEFLYTRVPAAQLLHAAAVATRAHLRAARDAAAKVAALSRGAEQAALKVDPEKLAGELTAAVDQIADIQRRMWETSSTSEFNELMGMLAKAQDDYGDALLKSTQRDAAIALRKLDDRIAQLDGAVEAALNDPINGLNTAVELARKEGYAEVMETVLKEHDRIIKSLESRAAEVMHERTTVVGLAAGLKNMGDQYMRLADFAKQRNIVTARGAIAGAQAAEIDAALALNAEAAAYWNRAGLAKGVKRVILHMADTFSRFLDPGLGRTGMLRDETHQVYARTLGEIDQGAREVTDVLRVAVEDGSSRAETVARWVDSTEGIRLSESRTTILNTSDVDGRTRWQTAWAIIKADVFQEASAPDLLPAQALYRSFLPPGDHRGMVQALDNAVRGATKKFVEETGRPPSFVEFMDLVQKTTTTKLADFQRHGKGAIPISGALKGPVMDERDRAFGLAAFAVNEAAALRRAGDRLRSVAGKEATDTAWDAARVLLQNPGNVEKLASASPDEIMDALEILASLGSDIDRTRFKGVRSDFINTWTRLADPDDEASVFLPTQWMHDMNARIGQFVKQEQAFVGSFYDPVEKNLGTFAGNIMRMWSASLITGLVLPRPAHFFNIFVGNFGQVWAEQGLDAAGRYLVRSTADLGVMAFGKLGAHIPFGKLIDENTQALRAANGGLPTATEAIANPHVSAIFDVGRFPNDLKIKGSSGREITFGQLRRAMTDQGIFSTFSTSSGLAALLRRRLEARGMERARNAVTTLGRYYNEVAEVVEQRQRAALFAEAILDGGKSFDEAGRMTREALYDWNYPMTSFEQNWLQSLVMFYTFQRRAMGQGARLLLDPVARGADATLGQSARRTLGGALGAVAMGEDAYKTTHLRDMGRGVQALRESFNPGTEVQDYDGDGVITEDDEMAHLLRRVYPWYAAKPGSRFHFANMPVDANDTAWHRRFTGRNFTHEAYTLPSMTPVETTALYVRFASLLAAFAGGQAINTARGAAGLPTRPAPTLSQTAAATGDILADFGGPLSGEILRSWYQAFSEWTDDKYVPAKGVRVTRHTDRMVMAGLQSFLGGGAVAGTLMWDDPDGEGSKRAHPGTIALYRTLPILGNEVANTLEPMLGMPPSRKENVAKMMGWFMGQYLGIGKAAFHEPLEVILWDERGMQKEITNLEARMAREPYGLPQYLTDPGADPLAVPTALDRFSTRKGSGEKGTTIRQPRLSREMVRTMFRPTFD